MQYKGSKFEGNLLFVDLLVDVVGWLNGRSKHFQSEHVEVENSRILKVYISGNGENDRLHRFLLFHRYRRYKSESIFFRKRLLKY
jgi:hypothetical protein